MNILVLGSRGMLGHKLYQVLGKNFTVYGTIRGEFESIEKYGLFERGRIFENVDVSDSESLRPILARTKPDIVINAVGVIKQLPDSKQVVNTLTINSIFPHKLAELGAKHGFRTITVSTDCVFSGKRGNYSEEDIPDAVDLYGQSKRFGELFEGNVLTLRTSIIGRELGTFHSLVDWFISNREKTVDGYTNAIFSGFPTLVFAEMISKIITEHNDLKGLYHVSSEPISKFELLGLINRRLGLNVHIKPFDDFEIDRSLDSSRFRSVTGFTPASWPEMIDRMCSDPTPYHEWN